LNEFPVFHRKGSILPIEVQSDDSLHGDADSIGAITALVHPERGHSAHIPIRRWKKESIEMEYSWLQDEFIFSTTRTQQRIILLIQGIAACPTKVRDLNLRNDLAIQQTALGTSRSGVFCDLKKRQLFVQTESNVEHIQIFGLQTY